MQWRNNINSNDFKPLELTDKITFDVLRQSKLYDNYYASDLNFLTLYSWKDLYKTEVFIDNDLMIFKDNRAEVIFSPPLAKSKTAFNLGIDLIKDYCKSEGIKVKIQGISDNLREIIDNKENYDFMPQPEHAEYIYNSCDLINLNGKKLHAKRNHVNRFIKTYSYQFVPYQENFRSQIQRIIEKWNEKQGFDFESQAICNALNNLEILNSYCDCLFVEKELVGFAIGTTLKEYGLVVFEKCDSNYIGVYQIINNLFAAKNFKEVSYINRQEDLGIEALKKAKMSYYPVFLQEKYLMTEK